MGDGVHLYFQFHQKTSFLSVLEPKENFLKIWKDFIKNSQSYNQNRKKFDFFFTFAEIEGVLRGELFGQTLNKCLVR